LRYFRERYFHVSFVLFIPTESIDLLFYRNVR